MQKFTPAVVILAAFAASSFAQPPQQESPRDKQQNEAADRPRREQARDGEMRAPEDRPMRQNRRPDRGPDFGPSRGPDREPVRGPDRADQNDAGPTPPQMGQGRDDRPAKEKMKRGNRRGQGPDAKQGHQRRQRDDAGPRANDRPRRFEGQAPGPRRSPAPDFRGPRRGPGGPEFSPPMHRRMDDRPPHDGPQGQGGFGPGSERGRQFGPPQDFGPRGARRGPENAGPQNAQPRGRGFGPPSDQRGSFQPGPRRGPGDYRGGQPRWQEQQGPRGPQGMNRRQPGPNSENAPLPRRGPWPPNRDRMAE